MRTGTRSCRWLDKKKNSRTDSQFWKDYRKIMCGYGNEEKKKEVENKSKKAFKNLGDFTEMKIYLQKHIKL